VLITDKESPVELLKKMYWSLVPNVF